MATPTFFWHDYETFGSDPRRDRPAQFAGIRTTFDLEPVGEPVEIYCQPSDDYLPDPEAVAITGITPQTAAERGVIEAEFIARIHAQLAAPGTCGVGYNTLRFDDELTRHLLWRNLWPPYDREWREGCSRWDLLDMVRACYAFRPEGIDWPRREDGGVSFRLGDLTAANGLAHEHAHDALSDVRATIGLARLVKTQQPRLFAHCLKLRQKAEVVAEIGPLDGRPFLHVSGMFGAARSNVALVAGLGWHPVNRNELIVWDLAHDPAELADLTADTLRRRLFTRADALPAGETRLPIKTIHINRSPVVVGNLKVLDAQRAEALGLDRALAQQHAQRLPDTDALRTRLKDVFQRSDDDFAVQDPDAALYAGFVGDTDARQLAKLRSLSPAALAAAHPSFKDPRLPELLFRYRARNWPASLNADEQAQWQQHRRERLQDGVPGFLNLAGFAAKLAQSRLACADHPAILQALDDLATYAATLAETLETP